MLTVKLVWASFRDRRRRDLAPQIVLNQIPRQNTPSQSTVCRPEGQSLPRLAGQTSAGRLRHCDRNTSIQRRIRSQTGCGSSRPFQSHWTMRPECEHASAQTCDESGTRDRATSAYYLGHSSPQSCDTLSLFTRVASVRGMKDKYSSMSPPSIRYAMGQPCSSRQSSLIRSDYDDSLRWSCDAIVEKESVSVKLQHRVQHRISPAFSPVTSYYRKSRFPPVALMDRG
jgi:hypothetical protein